MILKSAIKCFEGMYEVSSEGCIYSLDMIRSFGLSGRKRVIKGRKLKSFLGGSGYHYVTLCTSPKLKRKFLVHRLVAEAFIPNPENKPEVNHIDGDKNNNCVSNLEWVSRSENESHSFQIGLKAHLHGKDSIGSKYTYFSISLVTGEITAIMVGDKELLSNGFIPSNVRRVCRGEGLSHKGCYFLRIEHK